MRALLAAVLLLAAAQTYPVEAPSEFAYGRPLVIEPGAAVYEVDLPEDVYRGVTRRDLGDLRVFNATDAAVPHVLRSPGRAAEPPERTELPVFPLHGTGSSIGDDLSVDVATGRGGAVLRMRVRPSPESSVRGYLLDASALRRPIGSLSMEFAADDAYGLAAVRVDVSDDLSHWQTLVGSATVGRLAYGEHRLSQAVIELPPSHAKYLRLTWAGGVDGPAITGVTAELEPASTGPARHWLEVEGVEVQRGPSVYEYDTGGVFPVDRLELRLPANALLAASVYSRALPDGTWTLRHRGLHYQLRTEEGEIRSAAAGLPPVPDRYWRVEAQGTQPGSAPALRVGWTAHRLVFLASGEPPYLLAFGNAAAAASDAPLDALIASVTDERGGASLLRQAGLGERVVLGGEARLRPLTEPFSWRRGLLWSVLVAGVLVLLVMVRRLSHQMATPPDARPDG